MSRNLSFQLTFILLTRRIWWSPTNASEWQMGFNSASYGLKLPWLMLKSTSPCSVCAIVLLLKQIIIIFRRSDNFIISAYAVTRIHGSPHLYNKVKLKVKLFHPKTNETPTSCNTVQVLFLQGHSTCFGPNKEMWWLTCNDNTCTSGRCTSFKYSWWWALAPETCRVTLQK